MRCPSCGHTFRVPEGEDHPGEHRCPYCLFDGDEEPEGEDDDDG